MSILAPSTQCRPMKTPHLDRMLDDDFGGPTLVDPPQRHAPLTAAIAAVAAARPRSVRVSNVLKPTPRNDEHAAARPSPLRPRSRVAAGEILSLRAVEQELATTPYIRIAH